MKTIYVFGDSHSSMFNVSHRKVPVEGDADFFKVSKEAVEHEGFEGFNGFVDRSSGVPLAYSLDKHHEVIMKELESIPFTAEDEMWFIFGEIDVRFHIFYWHQKLEITLDESVDRVVDKYILYVNKLRNLGYNIHIVSVVPPQPNPSPFFNDPTLEIKNPVRGAGITVEDRVYMTNRLNKNLKIECNKNDIPFRDVHTFIVDCVTGCNIPEWTRDKMHYYYIGDLIIEKMMEGAI